MEKSTKLGHRKGSGIAGNPECVGVGALVGGVPCWIAPVSCQYIYRRMLVKCYDNKMVKSPG